MTLISMYPAPDSRSRRPSSQPPFRFDGARSAACRNIEEKLFPGALRLDGIPDLSSDVRPAESGDGADAGGAGDVDLGKIAVDHVDADEQQSSLAQRGAERGADFAFALREFGGLRGAAADHVGAEVVGRRHAVDRAGEFAV